MARARKPKRPLKMPELIREYVRLQREYPRTEEYPQSHGPFDFEWNLEAISEECERFGFDPDLVCKACDTNYYPENPDPERDKATDELSLRLLEALIERDDLDRDGGSHPVGFHGQIPDSLINELALSMAECGWICKQEWSVPLAILLRHQLETLGPHVFYPQMEWEKTDAAWLKKNAPNMSDREIAEVIGVHHTTVGRWLKSDEFKQRLETTPMITPSDQSREEMVERLVRNIKARRNPA